MKTILGASLLLCSFTISGPLPLFGQGSLTPPGPPAPTMKTLDQVEPRMPIDVAHTTTNDDNEFILSSGGSYYLTGNIVATKTNAIHVTGSGVTVDLNGFKISRGALATGSGVLID